MKIPYFLLFSIAILTLAAAPSASAQTADQLLVTWRAENLYPADFGGRAMPTSGSPIRLAVELISGGKFKSLATADILWFVDETLLDRGVGLKSARFNARSSAANNHFARVQVRLAGKTLEETVRIPVKQVKVVVEAPVLNKILPAGQEIDFSAVPYFFNTESLENLVFNWLINSARQKQTGNGELTLKIGEPQTEGQRKMTITANVQNLNNPLEVAQERAIFSIK